MTTQEHKCESDKKPVKTKPDRPAFHHEEQPIPPKLRAWLRNEWAKLAPYVESSNQRERSCI